MSQGEASWGGQRATAWSGHLLSLLLLTGRVRGRSAPQGWSVPSLPGHLQLQLLPETRRRCATGILIHLAKFTVITT